VLVLGLCGILWVLWRMSRTARKPGTRDPDPAIDLGAVWDQSGLACHIWNVDTHTCHWANATAAKLAGLDLPAFRAQRFGPSAVLSAVHDADRAAVRVAYAAATQGESRVVSYRRDNGDRTLQLTELIQPIRDGRGKVQRVACVTLASEDGAPPAGAGSEADRLHSLGRLAGGIAHDFNNVLAVVLGNLEMLQEECDPCARAGLVGEAVDATVRGRNLTRTMLSYAARAPEQLQPVDLNEVVTGLRPLLRRTLPENIALCCDLSPRMWPLVGDRSLADSTLLNLVLNARDAMPAGGKLTVSTAVEPSGNGTGNAILTVEDTGTGIDPAVRARLFEAFVSSKGPLRNSGLGLAMVQGFVRQAGGEVDVTSSPGMGTRFRLSFPAQSPEDSDRPAAVGFAEPAPARPARILLVEDNEGVRNVFARMLRGAGHSVEAVPDGDAGARAFADTGPFELLLADMVVPGQIQGPDLAERLKRLHPRLRVLFMSGHARPDTALRHPFLQKPLSRRELLDAVSNALAR